MTRPTVLGWGMTSSETENWCRRPSEETQVPPPVPPHGRLSAPGQLQVWRLRRGLQELWILLWWWMPSPQCCSRNYGDQSGHREHQESCFKEA